MTNYLVYVQDTQPYAVMCDVNGVIPKWVTLQLPFFLEINCSHHTYLQYSTNNIRSQRDVDGVGALSFRMRPGNEVNSCILLL